MKRHAVVCATALAAALPSAVPVRAADWLDAAFDIERSAQAGAAFAAAKGGVLYSEKSRGRVGLFLDAPMPEGEWPVALSEDDELVPLTFKKTVNSFWLGPANAKTERVDVLCARKYGEITELPDTGKVRPSLCFRDSDGDQKFDQVSTGYAEVLVEMPSYIGPSPLFDVPRGITILAPDSKPLPPTAYVKRRNRPEEGKEGVVELRYDGMKGTTFNLTLTARPADAAAPLYKKQIEIARPAGAPVEVVLEHPIFGAPGFRRALGHDLPPLPPAPEGKAQPVREPPRPIPTMTLKIAKADAKSIEGTIVATFPDWVWYQYRCESPPPAGTSSTAAPPKSKPLCEAATLRQDNMVSTFGPR